MVISMAMAMAMLKILVWFGAVLSFFSCDYYIIADESNIASRTILSLAILSCRVIVMYVGVMM
jgi:hypothetical protein